MGNGPDGICMIGVERKRIRDMISSIEYGRLAGSQLPAMLKVYDFTYLIVEGGYRRNHESCRLELPAGKGKWKDTVWRDRAMDYRAVDAFLNTVRLKSPVQVIKTFSPAETAMEIHILHHWFNSKRWSGHKSLLQFPYQPSDKAIHGSPSLIRRCAKELEQVGWERSKDVERIFKTMDGLVNSTVEQWMLIDGITRTRATKIVKEIKGLK